MKIILDLLLLLLIIIYSYLESLVKVFIPRRRKSVAGEIVLITGAGHGIGRQTAYEFAKRKSRLVLWDINKHGVEETAAECRKLGATTHVFVVDCSNREEIYSSVNQVKKEVGDVTIVVNNAGAIYPADLLSTKDEEITKTFEVNILGHFWITKALLPSMIRRNHGHIVTVASVCGHGVIPYLIPYCIRVFSNESTLRMRWPKYWSFSFNISSSNEHPELISFRMDWLDLLAVQGTLKSLLQYHSSKASILWHSALFTVQLSHPYMTTGKTIAFTRRTFVGKVMSLLLNMLSRLVITFLPRSKRLLFSWLQSPSAVILEPQTIKSDTVSTVSPSISHEMMGPDAMIFVF